MNDNIWFKFNQFSATLPSGPEAIRSASIPCSATSAQILKFCHIARPQACHFVISSFCWSSCNRIQIQVLTSPFWREWVLSNFWVVQTGSSQQCWWTWFCHFFLQKTQNATAGGHAWSWSAVPLWHPLCWSYLVGSWSEVFILVFSEIQMCVLYLFWSDIQSGIVWNSNHTALVASISDIRHMHMTPMSSTRWLPIELKCRNVMV